MIIYSLASKISSIIRNVKATKLVKLMIETQLRQCGGSNFVNHLNTLRIREAQKLLKNQCLLPVNVVGQRVGFENKHYFSKVFRKYSGVTPGAYRNNMKDEVGGDVHC